MHCVLKQIISFDELKTDYKNPIDQCNSLNPVSCYVFVAISHNVLYLLAFCVMHGNCFELFATQSS